MLENYRVATELVFPHVMLSSNELVTQLVSYFRISLEKSAEV
jgi:hypothetical protein